MKLTIVVSDSLVEINGVAHQIDLTPFDLSGVIAVQYNGNSGEVEYDDRNENISSYAAYQPIINAFNAHIASLVEPEPSNEQRRTTKLQQLNAAYQTAMQIIKSDYTQVEIDGWPRQVLEAEKYRSMAAQNPNALPSSNDLVNFPVLGGLATANDEPLLAFVVGVENKVKAYDLIYGAITGTMQALKKQILAVDINDINYAIKLAAIDEQAVNNYG
ncbi:hypothetical protein [Dasania marina]|uniref:hypothetical protein n=1 Tax=Dasania marina TaxID=471499 RepID=UPI00035E3AA7|nr:hypothetical protein [Dasania marina]